MANTGVDVSDEVVTQFNSFKLQREPYNFRFFVYRIAESSRIVIDSSAPRTASYLDFCNAMPEAQCRYGLIDLEFTSDDGRATSKLVFIAWCPDSSKVKDKMLYAGSKEALKRSLVGVGIHLTATDQSELAFETILPAVKRFA